MFKTDYSVSSIMSSTLAGIPPRKRYLDQDMRGERTRAFCGRQSSQRGGSSDVTRHLDEALAECPRAENQQQQAREVVLQIMASEAIIALRRSHPTLIAVQIPKPISPALFLKRAGITETKTGTSERSLQLDPRLVGASMRVEVLHQSQGSQVANDHPCESKRFRTGEFGLLEMSQVEEGEDDASPGTRPVNNCGTPRKLVPSTELLTSEEITCVTPSRFEAARNLLALTK